MIVKELSLILEDIKNRKFIESYVVLFVGIGSSIIGIVGGDLAQKWVDQAILAILSALIYLIILDRRENNRLLDRAGGDIAGIVAYGTSRASLPSFTGFDLPNAKEEIIIQAVGHQYIVHQCLGLLEDKARSGCLIKILMMAPRDQEGNVNSLVADYVSHWDYNTDLQVQLDTTLATFRQWLDSLDQIVRDRIEIRQYLTYPVGNFLFVDKDTISGYVQVETPHLYRIDVHDLPHYRVSKAGDPAFFQRHVQAFQKFWDISSSITSSSRPTEDNETE